MWLGQRWFTVQLVKFKIQVFSLARAHFKYLLCAHFLFLESMQIIQCSGPAETDSVPGVSEYACECGHCSVTSGQSHIDRDDNTFMSAGSVTVYK